MDFSYAQISLIASEVFLNDTVLSPSDAMRAALSADPLLHANGR